MAIKDYQKLNKIIRIAEDIACLDRGNGIDVIRELLSNDFVKDSRGHREYAVEQLGCDFSKTDLNEAYEWFEYLNEHEIINGNEDHHILWYEDDGHFYFEDEIEKAEITELPDRIFYDGDRGYFLEDNRPLECLDLD